MAFIEAPPFPNRLTFGSTGGPEFSTDVAQRRDGVENRNQNWREGRCKWDVGSINRTKQEIEELVWFFHAVAQGQLNGFRFQDFTDYQFANPLAIGDGTTQTFQLVKLYVYGATSAIRALRKPRPGTLQFIVDTVLREDYDIDFTTGLVTFWTPPPDGSVIHGQGEFDVPVHFTQDHLPIRRIDPVVWSCEQITLQELRLPV